MEKSLETLAMSKDVPEELENVRQMSSHLVRLFRKYFEEA